LKESIAFGPKKVQWISYFVGEEIWPLIILNLDCFIFTKFNLTMKSMTSKPHFIHFCLNHPFGFLV